MVISYPLTNDHAEKSRIGLSCELRPPAHKNGKDDTEITEPRDLPCVRPETGTLGRYLLLNPRRDGNARAEFHRPAQITGCPAGIGLIFRGLNFGRDADIGPNWAIMDEHGLICALAGTYLHAPTAPWPEWLSAMPSVPRWHHRPESGRFATRSGPRRPVRPPAGSGPGRRCPSP